MVFCRIFPPISPVLNTSTERMTTLNTTTKSSVTVKTSGGSLLASPRLKHALLSVDFIETSSAAKSHLAPIGALPKHVQESIMVREMLAVLQGYSRDYVYVLPLESPLAPRQFKFDETLDSSLKHYVEELLPVASLFSMVARFVDNSMDYGCGMVMHAFGHSLRQFIQEYQVIK